MASIVRTVAVDCAPEHAWEALRDFGAVHSRLARGFVTDCVREGDDRIVTFADGGQVRERLVALDEDARRLAYAIVDGPFEVYLGVAQVHAHDGGTTRFEWTVYVLPDQRVSTVAAAMDTGIAAIKQTLEAG